MENTKLVLLDVYDTLLDMSRLENKVDELMRSKRGYALWMEMFMEYCFVDSCIEEFNKFTSIAKATLQMTAGIFKVSLTDEDFTETIGLLKHLPLRNQVAKGLSRLNDLGIRIAALTNAPSEIVMERMERTGLISFFEKVLSAENFGKYKPWAEVYLSTAQTLELKPEEILLVTVHGWDLAGAHNVKMKTAYIKQPRQMLYPLTPVPDIICSDLVDLADQLRRANEERQLSFG
jgi:2-haloacid dehalogenase